MTSTKRRGQLRKVDPSKGLHELCRPSGSVASAECFSFQLQYMKEQCEDILQYLERLVENTFAAVPRRSGGYRLHRGVGNRLPSLEESSWEEAMYRKWSRSGVGAPRYLPTCPHIQTYQFPLKNTAADGSWGRIDLLGIGPDCLPVPNELKKRYSADSPLRMVIEVAAYGFALSAVWPNLKPDWQAAMERRFGSCPKLPDRLDEGVRLVCVAPSEYWDSYIGRNPTSIARRVPENAWAAFWKLLEALAGYFDIDFAEVEGNWNGETLLPTLSGARLLNLRSFTMERGTK